MWSWKIALLGKPSHCAPINRTHVQWLTIHLTGQASSSIILMGHTELNRDSNLTFYRVHCIHAALVRKKLLGRAHEERGTLLGSRPDNPIRAKWWRISMWSSEGSTQDVRVTKSSVFISDAMSCGRCCSVPPPPPNKGTKPPPCSCIFHIS